MMKLTNRIAEQLRRPQGFWGVMTGIFMSFRALPYAWDISIADSESPLTNPNLGKKGRQDSLR